MNPQTPGPALSTNPAPAGAVFTLAEAAQVAGVSTSTIKRRRVDLLKAGATSTPQGWQVPVSALVAVGLLDGVTGQATVVDPVRDLALTPLIGAGVDPLEPVVRQLRQALADAERRAAVAEAISVERDRLIEAQSRTIAALEARTEGEQASDQHRSPREPAHDVADVHAMPREGGQSPTTRWSRWRSRTRR